MTGGSAIPRDRWVCYELHVTIATAGALEVLVDGTRQVDVGPIDTLTGTAVREVTAGLERAMGDQAPAEIFVDEVVIDTAPIGCE
jgi:hypothetical protein